MKKYRVVDEENKLIADVDINDSGFHVEWAGVEKDVNSFEALLESLPEGKSWRIQRYQRVNESTNVRRYKQYSIAGHSLGRCEYLVYDLLQNELWGTRWIGNFGSCDCTVWEGKKDLTCFVCVLTPKEN